MSAESTLDTSTIGRPAPRPEAAFTYVALAIVATLGLFWTTTMSMVEAWGGTAGTFQHCFAVFPIVLWLIWRQRAALAATPLRPFWPGIGLMLMTGATWLLGVLAEAPFVSQFSMVALACALVWTLFGTGWVRVIWFPLAFMFFAVPFGEVLIPRLMYWTADFTVLALKVSGVPVFREGTHLVIPSGRWSVVEACSGIKFLISSVTMGSLYAWLMYRSPARRILFLVASIVVPLIANWLRAYLIVIVGHLSGNRLMTNDDHIVFGWVLFGGIMLGMYWFGARWREDHDHDLGHAPTRPGATVGAASARQMTVAVAAALVVTSAWPVLAAALLAPPEEPRRIAIVVPEGMGGWLPSGDVLPGWRPDLMGAPELSVTTYRKGDRRVGLFVAGFGNLTQEFQLATSANQIVAADNPRWQQTSGGVVATGGAAGVPQSARAARLRSGVSAEELVVWQWYWVGSRATTSNLQGKLSLAVARLRREPDFGLWVAIFAPVDRGPDESAAVLRDFVKDMDTALQAAFEGSVR